MGRRELLDWAAHELNVYLDVNEENEATLLGQLLLLVKH